jgi:glycosyltransferase involved in cell wall biosynthesis
LKRILLDVRQTRQMSVGMKLYARELAARLPNVAPEFEYVAFLRGGNFGLHEQVALPFAVARSHASLIHYLSIYTPLVSMQPSVVTVHDLIHLLFPRQFKAKVGPYYRLAVRRACQRAARVITDDERTVEDLERFLGVDPQKIRVIPLGTTGLQAQESQTEERSRLQERPYFLYVGNHRAHKNLQTLFDAWRALTPQYEVDLCLTGSDDFGGALQRISNGRRRAYAAGDLSHEELAARYRGAVALVHPALREGFGLPMLEAMAAGTPVIASAESVPRVLESAALVFPARDVGMLSTALMNVLSNQGLREQLVNQGRMTARLLTWDRCARATADVYHEILG